MEENELGSTSPEPLHGRLRAVVSLTASRQLNVTVVLHSTRASFALVASSVLSSYYALKVTHESTIFMFTFKCWDILPTGNFITNFNFQVFCDAKKIGLVVSPLHFI